VMYDMPRSATVKAVTDVTLLSLSREDLFSTLDASKVKHMKVLARAQVFSNLPMFSKLDGPTKVLISGMLRPETWTQGSIILRENNQVAGTTRRLYIIETGHGQKSRRKIVHLEEECSQDPGGEEAPCLVRSRTECKKHTSSCQPGDYFGMLEFLYGCPQLQSLEATETMMTLSISYDEMLSLLTEHSLDAEMIVSNMLKSVRIHLIKEAHPVLKELSMKELDTLLASARTQTYQQWETMFRKGERMQQLTIMEKGRCIEYDGNADTLMELDLDSVECTEHTSPGELGGTSAVVVRKDPPAPFTIVAIDVCHVVHISKTSLEALPRFKNVLPKI